MSQIVNQAKIEAPKCANLPSHLLIIRQRALSSHVLCRLNHIKLVLFGVETTPCEPETNTSARCQNRYDGIVPDEKRIIRQRDQGLTKGGGESILHQIDAHNEATHVLWCLAEGVLQSSDRGKDF